MKKTLSFLLAMLLLMSMGSSVLADGEPQVFWYTFADVYLSSVREALDKAYLELGIQAIHNDANATQATQTDQITTAIASGAGALVVNVVETGAAGIAEDIVSKAKEANIPLIFFNRSVDQAIVESYDKAIFVGTNYEDAGKMQGEMIGKYLLEKYDEFDLNKDGVISYVMFKGDEANQEAIARTKYGVENANAVLTAAGKPELKFYDESNTQGYLVDQNGTWSRTVAQDYMTTILSQYTVDNNNMVELVIANNDEMAIGAVQALQQVGFNNGEGTTNIPTFGVDATDDAKNLISQGFMAGTIKQDAVGMADAIARITLNYLSGLEATKDLNEAYVREGTWKIAIPYSEYLGE